MKKAIFVLSILLLFGFGCQNDAKKEKERLCIESGGTYSGTSCDCPKLFPVYNRENQRCVDAYGQSPTSEEEASRLQERVDYVDLCKKKEFESVYVVPNSPVTFCYPTSWGNTKVESLGSDDSKLDRVDFYVQKNKKNDIPRLFVGRGSDFVDSEFDISFCTTCLAEEGGEERFSESVRVKGERDETASVEVIGAGGVEGRIISSDTFGQDYYVSMYSSENLYLVVATESEDRELLNDFIETVWFDNLAQ